MSSQTLKPAGFAAPQSGNLQDTLAYWTPERLAAAQPRPIRPVPAGWEPQAPPSTAPAPRVAYTQPVETPAQYPYCCVGMLYFTLDGNDFYGSASVVNPNGILTAGHNLYDPNTGGWSTQLMFYPAAVPQAYPFGGWAVVGGVVATGWVDAADHNYDLGFCRTSPTGTTHPTAIGLQVGTLGIVLNQPLANDTTWDGIGYPGDHLREQWSSLGVLVQQIQQSVVKEDGLATGASGGPWFLDGLPAGQNVNGILSFGGTQIGYSPYFTDWVGQLYQQIFG